MARRGTPELMRGLNRTMVINVVREHGLVSRADLSRYTALSPASVSVIVADLIEEGVLREDGHAIGDIGRPGRLLRFGDSLLFVGCDLASSEGLRMGLMRLSGEVVETRVLNITSRRPTTERVARLLADYIVDAAARFGPARIAGIGVGVPGVVNANTGYVEFAPLLGWNDADFGLLLRDYLGIPVSVDNDVALSLAAEVDRGAATKAREAVLIEFAEGVGGAVLLDGRIHRGRGAAGEMGHMVPYVDLAPKKYSGIGALEHMIFELVADEARRRSVDPSRYKDQTARLVHRLRRSPGRFEFSADIFDRLTRTIGAAVASSIAVLDPEVVLLSGWIESAGPGTIDRVSEHAAALLPSVPPIQFSAIGNDRVVVGAALAARRTMLSDLAVVESTQYVSHPLEGNNDNQ
jgi:N-acetylglucosamine repressor